MQDVLNLLKKPVLSITGEDGLFIVFRKVQFYRSVLKREREVDNFSLHSLGTMCTLLLARTKRTVKKF